MLGGKSLEKKIERLTTEIDTLENLRDEAVMESFYTCQNARCKKKTKVKNTWLIMQYRYHKSYNSYEDSSWDFSCYGVACEKCKQISVVQEPDKYSKNKDVKVFEFIKRHEDKFKDVIQSEGLEVVEIWNKIKQP